MVPVCGTVVSRESNHDPLWYICFPCAQSRSLDGRRNRLLARKRGMPFFLCLKKGANREYIRSGLLQLVLDGVAGSGTAGGHLNLVIDRRQVGVNRAGTDHELVSDLGI